jgi:hypothetical protein
MIIGGLILLGYTITFTPKTLIKTIVTHKKIPLYIKKNKMKKFKVIALMLMTLYSSTKLLLRAKQNSVV